MLVGMRLNEPSTDASHWATRITDAIAHDQFVLHFQPIVRLADATVAYHEVLLRMREPDGTTVPPGVFIPAAERYSLASAVDEWVVNAVIRTLTQHDHLNVCVNLFPSSLGDELLLQRLERRLIPARLRPGQLVFEITEKAVVQDIERARHWMERLSRTGCRFALDDFGMGFSAFSHLRGLPVDDVKIDGSFVRSMASDPTSAAIVGAITNLSHALGKQVIAEWVEDSGTAQQLAELGVDYGQGYLWSEPFEIEIQDEASVVIVHPSLLKLA